MPISAGSRVRARGDVWTLRARTPHVDCEAVTLSGASPTNSGSTRALILPFDRLALIPSSTTPRVVRRRRWAATVLRRMAAALPFGSLSSLATARLDLLPFQIEPALAMLRHGAERILIADQVGLGKTIQAGIVLAELVARLDACRALVLCPAGLREQWRTELAGRFQLETVHADALWLAERSRELPPEVNPWGLPGTYVASLDLVKRPEVLRALEDVTWDLVVVDEAHNCGAGTARLAAAHAVACRARRGVLMTATPPDGDPHQLDAMRSIGALDNRPLVEFRRTREDVSTATRRRSRVLHVRVTAAERRMHRLLERYTAAVWREAADRSDPRARLAVTILRKRALSSAASLEVSIRRRQALLAGSVADSDAQLALPFGDEDEVDDQVPDAVLGTQGLSDRQREAAWLEDIAGAASLAARDESKLRVLRRFLRRAKEPVIVFTEYRDTLERLERALGSASIRPVLLHGGMPARERAAAQRAFSEAGTLLLATDAASEGLNLHARCRTVVHFELPWTQTRLEQRAGRVDRLGQTRAVHELMLVARDTAERLVLGPLVRRAQAARETTRARTAIDLNEEATAEARRASQSRVPIARRSDAQVSDGTVVCASRRRKRAAATLVYVVSLEDRFGAAVHCSVVALQVGSLAPRSRRARELKALVTALEPPPAGILDAVMASAESALATARRQHAAVMASLAERENAIERKLPSTARTLVQVGLFDNRALRALDHRRQTASLLAEDADDRRAALTAPNELQLRVRLSAVRFE